MVVHCSQMLVRRERSDKTLISSCGHGSLVGEENHEEVEMAKCNIGERTPDRGNGRATGLIWRFNDLRISSVVATIVELRST